MKANANMTSFEDYAKYYDLLYQDKNYEKECDFIEEIFHRFSSTRVKSVLDAGCGTGGHAIPLARRSYAVTGVDSSEIALKLAQEKAGKENPDPDMVFYRGDLRQLDLGRQFDACICMFSVVGYITETDDFIETVKRIRRHLECGSIFTFDFWNGLAVLRIMPAPRIKTARDTGLSVIRVAQPELDALNHLCRVHYHLLVNREGRMVDEVTETHVVRYYFPQEIRHYLHDAGFEVLRICPFLDIDGKVDENVWNVTVIARAV